MWNWRYKTESSLAMCLGWSVPQLGGTPRCSDEEVLGPQSQLGALYVSAPPVVGLAEVHIARVSAGKIQQLHQWFLLRHRMPWKEKSFCWFWSIWPCLKEGTFLLHRYETWSRSQAYSRSWSSVGTGSHPQPLPSLSLCIWARVKCSVGHSWINMECLFMYKCTLKSCAAILSCYTEVSKTSGPVWSLWNDKNNNEESLIGFCESRMNYLLLCLWSAYWKRKNNLIFWMFSTSLN